MIFSNLQYNFSNFVGFSSSFLVQYKDQVIWAHMQHQYCNNCTKQRSFFFHLLMELFLQDLQEFLWISCAARQDSCKISYSCRKHYFTAFNKSLPYLNWIPVDIDGFHLESMSGLISSYQPGLQIRSQESNITCDIWY